jgi:SPP1 family phage portal protein
MLTVEEIKQFIDEDASSMKKQHARKGQDYYEGRHDILDYILYYYNANNELVEDKNRSNIKIPHPFFTELVDQGAQYILSGSDGIIKSDNPELQTYLNEYFNDNEDFIAELSEVLTGCQAKGFEYMYARKNKEGKLEFECADSLGVVEVEARFAQDGKANIIYHYVDRVDKDGRIIKKIIVCDAEFKYFYTQMDDGTIEPDNCYEGQNKKPHATYKVAGDKKIYYEDFGFVPFFRLDNNKKQVSSLKIVKPLIDDYDLMSCGLSNNIQDSCEYTVVTKGFEGNIEELIHNTRTKKAIGVTEGGDVDFKTVNIPYEARKAKLELDEKNIYRFGQGLNMAGLKDTSATTNIAIKAMYALLDLRCSKLEIKLKQFLRKIIKVVLDEINAENGTDYQQKDVWFNFEHEVMSNEKENAEIAHIDAQRKQVEINVLLALAAHLDNETLMQNICDVLEIDYEEIKGKLPDPDEAENEAKGAQDALNGVVVENESKAEGSPTAIPE